MNKRQVFYEDDYAWTTTPQGNKVLVSLEDVDLIEENSIFERCKKSLYPSFRVNSKTKMQHLHKAIQKRIGFEGLVDHKNMNRFDVRRNNLRPCTQIQNAMNTKLRADSTSKYKGVTWRDSHNKYRAVININKKPKFLGSFDTPEDAAKAYDEAALIHFGEFAQTNKMLGLL